MICFHQQIPSAFPFILSSGLTKVVLKSKTSILASIKLCRAIDTTIDFSWYSWQLQLMHGCTPGLLISLVPMQDFTCARAWE